MAFGHEKRVQTRGLANLAMENVGKIEGVANWRHACPPNSVLIPFPLIPVRF